MAIVTCLIGLHYGHIIVHCKVWYSYSYAIIFLYFSIWNFIFMWRVFLMPPHLQDHRDRMRNWVVLSTSLLALGLALDLCGKYFSFILSFLGNNTSVNIVFRANFLLPYRRTAYKQTSIHMQLYVSYCWSCWLAFCCNLLHGWLLNKLFNFCLCHFANVVVFSLRLMCQVTGA